MKRVAIVQSNYIPWKGYFDLIASVDEFIVLDNVQYTRRDWRNRNKIKTPQGLAWLTVPVRSKGKYDQLINETEIEGRDWADKHWQTICNTYRKARHFDEVAAVLEPLYTGEHLLLSDMNLRFMRQINAYLKIDTMLVSSTRYPGAGTKTDLLLSLCSGAGASVYVSGPSAAAYIETDKFEAAGIEVEWFDYAGYPEYPQLWGPFEHGVSVIDLMFNCGPDARTFMERAK